MYNVLDHKVCVVNADKVYTKNYVNEHLNTSI